MGRRKKIAQNNTFRHFSSLAEFSAAAAPVHREMLKKYAMSDKWAGGSVDDAVNYCARGDLSSVPAASALCDMVNDAVDLAGVRQEWAPDVVGAFPSVPAFLAGDPCSMWARSPVQDERGEIDVYFDTGVSWRVSRENMQRRGVCVLAALLALQRVRNVRAHLYTSQRVGNIVVDLSYPFDISEICAVCACPVITRRLVYAFAQAAGDPSVGWADWSARVCGRNETEKSALREYIGISPSSLVITSQRLGTLAGVSDSDLIADINKLISSVNDGADNLTI